MIFSVINLGEGESGKQSVLSREGPSMTRKVTEDGWKKRLYLEKTRESLSV